MVVEYPAVPTPWRTVPAWALFRRFKRTGFPEEELLSVYQEHGVIPKSSRDDNHNVESEDLNGYQLVEPGDLVMNKMKAWQGSIAISEHRGIVSPAYFVFKVSKSVDPKYIHYLMRSAPLIAAYNRISKGVRVSQWDLEPQEFRKLPILVPPLAEQRRIAEHLDKELRLIAEMEERQQRLIALLSERNFETIRSAVTTGLRAGVRLTATEAGILPLIPEHWASTRIARAFELTLGKALNSNSPREELEAPYLRAGNIQDHGVDLTEVKTMPVSRSELTALSLRAGDVVVVEGGAGYGRADFLNEDLPGWVFQNHVIRARARAGQSGRFLTYYIQYLRGIGHFEKLSGFATIPNVSAEKLGGVEYPQVPFLEAEAVADFLDAETSRSAELIGRIREHQSLARERKSALISSAVLGLSSSGGQN